MVSTKPSRIQPDRLPNPRPDPRGPVTCPPDLELKPDQVKALEFQMVEPWAIRLLLREYAAQWAGDDDDKRTVTIWRRCAVTYISRTWHNSARRPVRPEASDDGHPRPPSKPRNVYVPPDDAIPCPPEIAARVEGFFKTGSAAPERHGDAAALPPRGTSTTQPKPSAAGRP